MKEIPLTQGKVALVDDDDWEKISKFTWYATHRPHTSYAATNSLTDGHHKVVYMHRFILDADDSKKVDHIDGDGLNNQKSNIRTCTAFQNMANASKHLVKTSLYKGVSWDKIRGKWRSQIGDGATHQQLGRFSDEVQAALAYDAAAKERYGDFARLNFP